jgi:hypothetical protein
MGLLSRAVAAWISAASLGACLAFTRYQILLGPDFSVLEWRLSAAWLFVVAVVATALAVRPSLVSRSGATIALVGAAAWRRLHG